MTYDEETVTQILAKIEAGKTGDTMNERNCKELQDALEAMLRLITSGKHYETQNPYTRPEVEQAYKALGRNWRSE